MAAFSLGDLITFPSVMEGREMRQSDEQLIRDLVATWIAATRDDDSQALLGILATGAVLLLPGRAPLTKTDIAKAAEGKRGNRPKVAVAREILEIEVLDNWAFLRTRLSETATSADGSSVTSWHGHTLTVLRKEDGTWKVARDANLAIRET
jgi:uncharacterized protein (TIGR02246 family)